MSNINYDFIESLENFKTNGYVPNAKRSKSGVTIGSGVDLGARSVNDLKKLNLSEELIAKLKPYLGRKSTGAESYLKKNPLNLSTEEARYISRAVQTDISNSLAKKWKAETGQDFSELPENQATAVASVAFQYGVAGIKKMDYWKQVTSNDWKGAYAELRDFQDDYSTRREKEAAFLGPQIYPELKPKFVETNIPIVARAEGGPVNAGQPYLVGEEGPELIIPNQDAVVLPTNSPETQETLNALSAGVSGDAANARALGQSLASSSFTMGAQKSPTRNKVKYIKFDDPKAPRIEVPEDFTQDQINEYLKSDSVEAQMYDKGFLFKYGLQPSNFKDNSNTDDYALTAGIKSGYDNLKAIGAGALYTVADTFGSEENMAKFERLREQYNQDAAVHVYKEGEGPGGIESRITSIEDALQSEAKLSAFLDWAAFNTGAGATTMIPIIMASAVGAGVGALTVGAGAAGASIAGMMAAYSMGVGEATGAQLDRSGDANAALSLAAGIPYAAAERYLGTSMMLTRLFKEKYGGEFVKKLIKDTTIKNLSEKKIKNSIIKEVSKGFGKEFIGEGITEAAQEAITSTAAEINEGASLAELYSSKDFWKQLGEAAAAGAIAGGTIGGTVGGPITYIKKSGTKNIEATGTEGGVADISNTEAIAKTGGEVGDVFIYTGLVNDTEDKTVDAQPKEYTLEGTAITSKGEEVFIMTPVGGGNPVLVPFNQASKLTKSRLNKKDKATLDDGKFLPEDVRPTPSKATYNKIVKDLKSKGIISTEQTPEDLVGLPPLNDFLEQEFEEYTEETIQQKNVAIEEGSTFQLPAHYKNYQGLEGDDFNKLATVEYYKQLRNGIIDFNNTTLASENQLSDNEKSELQKLGYYRGPRGIEFINRKLANTKVKDKADSTTGLQELREIITNQIPHTPQIVSSTNIVSRTQVPPLIPRSFEETTAGLDPDTATELETLSNAKRENAWQLAKSNEVIEQLKNELETLDPNSPNLEAENTRLQNEINFLESRKQAVAKAISDPLARILKIREITTHMNNSGFRVNMIQYYRQALKQARKDKDAVSIQFYQDLIKKYKPTNEHVFVFNNTLVYLYTSKAKQQLEADAKELQNNIKNLLPNGFTRDAYRALTEDKKILYRVNFKELQRRLNAIKTIDSKRAELNSLLETFNEYGIEPISNWDKQKGKLSIPEFNEVSKKLLGYEKIEKEKVSEELFSLANHPDSLDRPALTQDTIDKMPMVLEDLRAELERLGVSNLDLRIYNSISNEKGAQVNGRFLGGLGLIEVAMNASQNVNGRKLNPADSRMFTMHHESMHYIFKNLLTAEEQVVLKDAARTAYIKRYNIKKRYEGFGLSEEALLEESISDAFAEYMATTSNGPLSSPKGMIATIFNRIRNYLIALGNALSNNQLRSTAQIFNNIDKGVMQARRDIMNKVDISRTEMINLASIGKISIEQAEKFFNQRGRSVVVVGGKRAGSALTNKQLYRSFVINILPIFYGVRQDPATNKIITALSNLFESITTDTGVPNLEQANFYLQQLNALTDKELNATAAYLQSNPSMLSEATSAAMIKSSMGTYAGQDVAALFELLQAVDLFKTRLVRLNRNMPTETDIRIAGTPLIVHHGTGQTAMASIMAGGFIASPNSMGMHFGTQAQATIRGKAMADADYQGTGLDAGKGLKTPEWWKPTSDLSAAIPSADTTRKTQRANTAGTYNKIKSKLKEGNTLDFGAGLGLGTEILKSDSFEPFPPANFVPTYQAVQQIPENSYDNIVSLNVLNVLPKASRNDAVRTIGRSLKVNGTAFITTRGMDIYGNKQNPARALRSDEVGSIITADGQSFQKGFTQAELMGYIQSMLGSGFSVEAIPEGAVGVKVTKLETSLTTPGILNAVLHIRNPVRMQDMGAQWDSFQVLNDISAFPTDPDEKYGMDIDVSRQMAPAMLTDIIFTPTESAVIRKKMTAAQDKGVPFKQGKSGKIIINKNYKPASLTRQEILQDAIKAKGYDGIVYRNQYEVTADYDGDGGAIESLDSYIVFDANQIQLVENNPNLDMSDINYSASSEGSFQDAPSDDKMSQPDTKSNRQATKEAGKGMDESGKAKDKIEGKLEDKIISIQDIGKASKFMMHARGLGAKFPVVAKLFNAVQSLEQKGRSIQTQFTAQMRNYFDVINRMEGAKEILAKAHIISQQVGAQAKYLPDAEGRIVFMSPISMTSGGANPISIKQGEVVILEGSLADVYLDSQAAIATILDEVKKGTIASTFVPQLKQAVEILSRMNPDALVQAGIDPRNIKAFDGDVIENLQYGQLLAIINGLAVAPQLLRDKALAASMNNPTNLSNLVETLSMDSAIIDVLIGTDATNLPALLKELSKFEQLKKFDYVPLQRYGTHAITVRDQGEVVRYEHIELPLAEEKAMGNTTSRKFAEVRSRLMDEYPMSEGYEVSEIEEITQDFRSRMPKDLSMIDSMAQHLSDKNAKKYDEVRKELDTIIGSQNITGFDKFVRGRKMIGGVPGFDGDILRSMSQFGMTGAEFAARNRYLKDVNNSFSDALTFTDLNKMPNLREAIEKMKSYGVDNMHSNEFSMPRRLGFWWFLGGNISSGILQTMSMVQFTGPMLAQFSNGPKAATQLSRAFVEVNRLLTFTDNQFNDVFLNLDKPRLMEVFKDAELVEAIMEDIANGIIKQGQALYESGQAPGYTLTPTDKTNMQIRGRIKQLEQGVMGGTFNTYETISRLSAYVAAHRLSQDPNTLKNADKWYSGSNFIWNEMKKRRGGMATSQDFARILIDDTFGDYSKINRPMMMRGAGSIFFLFQTYISQMFGLLRRLMVGQGNAEVTATGRKMFARIILMLFLTGGLMGLPGADDLDFIYRMVRKMGGVDEDLRTVMRETLVDLTGPKMTEAMMNGGIEAFGNINVQRRLSLGEVPGSGQARAIMTMLGFPTGAKAEEFLGAPGAVFFQSGKEMIDIFGRQGASALTDMDLYMAAAPTFIKNAYRAAYKYPQQGYVDTRRGTLLTADLNGLDLLLQGIGFTPTKISKARNVLYYEKQVDSKYLGTTQRFNAQIKNAFRDMYIGYNITNDKAMADAAQLEILNIMRQIQEFNSKVDSNYTYVPAISRLRDEGVKQANFNLRTLKASKKTFRKKQELPDQFDVNMN